MVERPTGKELDGWIAYVTGAVARIDSGRTERTGGIRAGRPPETVDPAFGLRVDELLRRVREIAEKIGEPALVADFNDRDPDTAERVCHRLLVRLRELRST